MTSEAFAFLGSLTQSSCMRFFASMFDFCCKSTSHKERNCFLEYRLVKDQIQIAHHLWLYSSKKYVSPSRAYWANSVDGETFKDHSNCAIVLAQAPLHPSKDLLKI